MTPPIKTKKKRKRPNSFALLFLLFIIQENLPSSASKPSLSLPQETPFHCLKIGLTQTDPTGVTQTDTHGVTHTVFEAPQEGYKHYRWSLQSQTGIQGCLTERYCQFSAKIT